MFLLVKWLKHNSVTVLEEVEEYASKEVGEKINVLYGKEYHEGVILSRSENKAFLDSLTVSKQGEILMKERKEVKGSLRLKQKACKSSKAKNNKLKKANNEAIASNIKAIAPIFQDKDVDDNADLENATSSSKEREIDMQKKNKIKEMTQEKQKSCKSDEVLKRQLRRVPNKAISSKVKELSPIRYEKGLKADVTSELAAQNIRKKTKIRKTQEKIIHQEQESTEDVANPLNAREKEEIEREKDKVEKLMKIKEKSCKSDDAEKKKQQKKLRKLSNKSISLKMKKLAPICQEKNLKDTEAADKTQGLSKVTNAQIETVCENQDSAEGFESTLVPRNEEEIEMPVKDNNKELTQEKLPPCKSNNTQKKKLRILSNEPISTQIKILPPISNELDLNDITARMSAYNNITTSKVESTQKKTVHEKNLELSEEMVGEMENYDRPERTLNMENTKKRPATDKVADQVTAKKIRVINNQVEETSSTNSGQEGEKILSDEPITESENRIIKFLFKDIAITSETVTLFERITKLLRSQADGKEFPVDDTPATKPKTQLKKGLPVYMDKSKLISLQRYRSKPNDLARALLYELVGAEALKTMCAFGRSKGKTAVPEDIREAIICYVQRKKTVPQEFGIKEMVKLINNTCGTLRHPKDGSKKDGRESTKKSNGEEKSKNKSNREEIERKGKDENEIDKDEGDKDEREAEKSDEDESDEEEKDIDENYTEQSNSEESDEANSDEANSDEANSDEDESV